MIKWLVTSGLVLIWKQEQKMGAKANYMMQEKGRTIESHQTSIYYTNLVTRIITDHCDQA